MNWEQTTCSCGSSAFEWDFEIGELVCKNCGKVQR